MRILIFGLLFYILLFILPFQSSAAIILNEVMSNALDEDTGEFLELYNTGDEAVDVGGWKFTDSDATDIIQPFKKDGTTIIPPNGYGVILDSEYAGQYYIPNTAILFTTKNTTLGDGLTTNDPITLFDSSGKNTIDTYSHPFNPGNGISVEKLDTLAGDQPDNWKACRDKSGSTPGRQNSFLEPLPEPTKQLVIIGPDNVAINRAEAFQLIVQFSDGATDADWSGQIKIEANPPSVRLFIQSDKQSKNTLTLELTNGVATFQLVATEMDTIQLEVQSVSSPEFKTQRTITVISKPLAPLTGDVIINEIMHSPNTKAGQVEWVELYNRSSQPADLSEWLIADARDKPVPIPAGTIIAPQGYLILTKDKAAVVKQFPQVKNIVQIKLPALNNAGDTVTLRNSRGKKVDEVKYTDSGSIRGRSLERVNPLHLSSDIANWKLSIDLSGATPEQKNSISMFVAPDKLNLQITPSPFNPRVTPTQIKYCAPTDAIVTIKLFDSVGKLIKTVLEKQSAGGKQTISWNGTDDAGKRVPVGLYICQIIASGDTRKAAMTAAATVIVAEKL